MVLLWGQRALHWPTQSTGLHPKGVHYSPQRKTLVLKISRILKAINPWHTGSSLVVNQQLNLPLL